MKKRGNRRKITQEWRRGAMKETRICECCKKFFIPTMSRQKRCGSYRKKIGCSWIKYKIIHQYLTKLWIKRNPDKMREHYRRVEVKRKKNGYYAKMSPKRKKQND